MENTFLFIMAALTVMLVYQLLTTILTVCAMFFIAHHFNSKTENMVDALAEFMEDGCGKRHEN